MTDIFFYNSGSLLQALNPSESLVDIAGDPMLDNVEDAFLPTVSQGDGVFGVPIGTGMGGGILYNRQIFEDNGLEVPHHLGGVRRQQRALLEAGIAPVGASFGTTWTSQLFVLADYYNIAQQVPDLAEQVHRERGALRRHTGGAAQLRAAAGGLRQGLVERGLRLGDL